MLTERQASCLGAWGGCSHTFARSSYSQHSPFLPQSSRGFLLGQLEGDAGWKEKSPTKAHKATDTGLGLSQPPERALTSGL